MRTRAPAALALLSSMAVDKDTITCHAAISALGRGAGTEGEALALLSSMAGDKDTITCNAAIIALGKGAGMGEALALLSSMARESSTQTPSHAMLQRVGERRWHSGAAWLSYIGRGAGTLEQHGEGVIDTDTITCTAAISACGQPALFIFRIARS